MKTFTFLLLIFFYPDTTKYEKVMLENIEAISDAESPAELQVIINNFERIAQKEKDRWEPYYYSAYCQILMAIREKEASEKDKFLDYALKNVKNGYEIASDESELIAMEGFVHMIRVTVDPATRGQQFAGLSMQTFQKAIAMDSENPRALYLLAQMEMGTARFFNSDITPACEKLKLSIEKFETDTQENILAPKWGKKQALSTLESCKN